MVTSSQVQFVIICSSNSGSLNWQKLHHLEGITENFAQQLLGTAKLIKHACRHSPDDPSRYTPVEQPLKSKDVLTNTRHICLQMSF